MKEKWIIIKDYPDYEISNLGNVKSIARQILKNGKYSFESKEKILKPYKNLQGYYEVCLYKNTNHKNSSIHKLVAIAFLNHIPCGYKLVINHINFNKLDNRVENLEIVTQRENSNLKHIKSTSKYVGVHWHKRDKKWQSTIVINRKRKHLGYFNDEIEAHNAYQTELKNNII